MKKIVFVISSLLLVGCANQQYPVGVNHGVEIEIESNKGIVSNLISSRLKDPDSLKNLVLHARKCFLSKPFVTDYVSNSESWCIIANYQAKNSYGGYVRGDSVIYHQRDSNQLVLSKKVELIESNYVYDIGGYYINVR